MSRGGGALAGRLVLVVALVAAVLSVAALAVSLHRPANPYPVVCEQGFTDAQTGRTVPMYTPCSQHRP